MYICPICKKNLKLSNRSYICENNHCFDISRQGYINLLTTIGHNPKNSGDNPKMVQARTAFLSKDYYKPLADKLSAMISSFFKNKNAIVIDSGCGEGYYSLICAENNNSVSFYGIDISKKAVSHASSESKKKELGNIKFAVSSSFELPFANNTADIITSIFAPVTNEEYSRVLKNNGFLIVVSPDTDHLFNLKTIIYEKPYKNKPNLYSLANFKLIEQSNLSFNISISDNADILNLFLMTPYYYKTSQTDFEKLKNIQSLSTQCCFTIQIYKKIS